MLYQPGKLPDQFPFIIISPELVLGTDALRLRCSNRSASLIWPPATPSIFLFFGHLLSLSKPKISYPCSYNYATGKSTNPASQLQAII